MTSLIRVPFADSGDKTVVPETDGAGGVNMTNGYGQAYSLDPATDPSAKRIEREMMNGLFYLITAAISEMQAAGVTPFITADDNAGSAFAYGKGALTFLSGVVYQSLTEGNTTTPPGASWAALANMSTALARANPFGDIKADGTVDTALANLGLGAGAPAIGIPFFWPSSAMPNTVMPEWAGMVFLKLNGATFSAATYPKLALAWPGLVLTESRGEFIRIFDDGRGVDSGRALLSAQSDGTRSQGGTLWARQFKVVGTTGGTESAAVQNGTGVFSIDVNAATSGWDYIENTRTGVPSGANRINLNIGNATETRPRNVAFNLLVRAK